MPHMKKYKCPACSSTKDVIFKTQRSNSFRYLCKKCFKTFSIKVVQNQFKNKDLMSDHLDGHSLRKLALKHGISKSKVQRIVFTELKKLPNNNQFTKKYCNRFSDILVVDAKYINVKGYERGAAFLWGIDYLRHDFPIVLLAPSESYDSWSKFFWYFRVLNHHYAAVVCDEHLAIKTAVKRNMHNCVIQICYNHVKEGIRRELKVRSEDTYKDFMKLIEDMFKEKRSEVDFNSHLFYIFKKYREDENAVRILTALDRKREYLLAFKGITSCPVTTNLMACGRMAKCFNSHLESRLKSIHKFEDFTHAKLWMNGYVLKRRFTPYSSCKGKFKRFNGSKPIDHSRNLSIDLMQVF